MKYLILGDVHADGQSFSKVVQFCIEQDIHLVSVGDLIDNGPDGEQVCSQFAYLLKKGKASLTWGNHEWKIYRYESEVRQGVTPTDDISKLDTYVQALRDVPQQDVESPWHVVWPTVPTQEEPADSEDHTT